MIQPGRTRRKHNGSDRHPGYLSNYIGCCFDANMPSHPLEETKAHGATNRYCTRVWTIDLHVLEMAPSHVQLVFAWLLLASTFGIEYMQCLEKVMKTRQNCSQCSAVFAAAIVVGCHLHSPAVIAERSQKSLRIWYAQQILTNSMQHLYNYILWTASAGDQQRKLNNTAQWVLQTEWTSHDLQCYTVSQQRTQTVPSSDVEHVAPARKAHHGTGCFGTCKSTLWICRMLYASACDNGEQKGKN